MEEICELNLNQPLVKFSAINGLLSVNFDPKVGLYFFNASRCCPLVPEASLEMGGSTSVT